MARLINDSGVLGDTVKVTANTVNSVSFDKIIEAIHVVQTEMGITGTTAKEAATTIAGSMASAKAAWSNLMTGLADENADMGELIGDFVESVGTVGDNVIPRVMQIADGIGEALTEAAPAIGEGIATLVSDVAPSLLSAAGDMLSAFGEAILSQSDSLIQSGMDLVLMILGGITSGVGSLASGAVEIVQKLSSSVSSNKEQLVQSGTDLIVTISKAIISAIPSLLTLGIEIVGVLAQAVVGAAFELYAQGPELLGQLADGLLSALSLLGDVGGEVVDAVLDGLEGAWPAIVDWAKSAWEGIKSIFDWDGVMSAPSNSPSSMNSYSGGADGSFAKGLDYVPFDGFIAELHKGERVLTAKEARAMDRGSGVTVTQYIYSEAKTAADLMEEAKYQAERAVLLGV